MKKLLTIIGTITVLNALTETAYKAGEFGTWMKFAAWRRYEYVMARNEVEKIVKDYIDKVNNQ